MYSLLLLSLTATASTHDVDSVTKLREAVAQAAPGDTIRVASGTYRLDDTIRLSTMGSADQPIRIEGDGAVRIDVDALIGFRVAGAHWHIANLEMVGVCASDHDCEHAFHVVGEAAGFELSSSVLRNFNAQIKANGEGGFFPDSALIVGNELYNDAPRQTDRPVVTIDVVGANDWLVEANHIHDIAKDGGNGVSYAAFFKGNGSGGRFERNLVVCEDLHSGGIRLGLSLGGGGTSPDSVCRDTDCAVEHTDGLIVNNIIARCPADVGIYLNAAAESVVGFNTLYDTTGIDVRFSETTAVIMGNVMDGSIRERDGGTADIDVDVPTTTATLSSIYTAPDDLDFRVSDPTEVWTLGDGAPEVDFCGTRRTDRTVLGAVDAASDCDTAFAPAWSDETGESGESDTGSGDDGADTGSEWDPSADDGQDGAPDGAAPSSEGDASSAEPTSDADESPTKWSSSGCQVAPLSSSLFALCSIFPVLIGRRRSC